MSPEIKTTQDQTIEFIQFHQPYLKDGNYEITVTQEIEGPGIPADTSFFKTMSFEVAGERFSLKEDDIRSVFPPPGNLGEYSNVLPHLILERSTMPWERQAETGEQNNFPWLALLLFNGNEKPVPQTLFPEALKGSYSIDEAEQNSKEAVTVIDVNADLLKEIIPTADELALLAHVRARGTEAEYAVVIGNRLPAKGQLSTVHLVSVESRYADGNFDYQTVRPGGAIRLVSLKSWSFTCMNEKYNFFGLLTNLNRTPVTLRLPENKNPDAENYLARGFVPLPHFLRNGEETISWYHGPFIPGKNNTDYSPFPIRASDQVVRYNELTGLFDISYAAAWEIGRLLALQSKSFSVSLFNWKRAHVQQVRKAEQDLDFPYLKTADNSASLTVPDDVKDWLISLSLFDGIPFNYLVPDPEMLPPESIRFFYVDPLWTGCLLDGAFSIGRVLDADHQQDTKHPQNPLENPIQKENVSGFLLRSEVVEGWPELEVNGYDKINETTLPIPERGARLKALRIDRLGPRILLCLFQGDIRTVDIHEKPEALHFGFEIDEKNMLYKELRNAEGLEQGNWTLYLQNGSGEKVKQFPWKKKDKRVIDISLLAGDIRDKLSLEKSDITEFTSASFGLEMIEGVEKVRFTQKKDTIT